MIFTSQLTVSFSGKTLFEDVSVKFLKGNCYGLIGANGAGKSTFLKLLSREIDPTYGQIIVEDGKRIAVLSQDQFAFDDYSVLSTVLMGHQALFELYEERNRLYSKAEMTDEEGLRVGELEEAFADLDGYSAESDAATMLSELGLLDEWHEKQMRDLDSGQKIRVLLAQALFGNPDILLLDEPTNQLDYLSTLWLENHLANYENTVIVVSHDRHFLNKVCTHIADIDYGQIKIYPGNYDFWKESSELAVKQKQEQNKKSENKIKELEAFVRRFSANASKSKQATSRKKLIEKLTPEELPTSTRKFPYIAFKPKRSCGNAIVTVENVSYSINGEPILSNVSFKLNKNDKVAIAGKNSVSKTILLDILSGKLTPDTGSIQWGESISISYFPKDNSAYFSDKVSLIDWLSEFGPGRDIQDIRGYLGRMLFPGDDAKKSVTVLSGGEKARAMFSKMMLDEANVLLFDEPTDHLDLEAISSLNEAFETFSDVLIFSSHDFQLLNSVCNRVIEVSPKGMIDRPMNFDEYMNSDLVKPRREKLYS